MTPPIHDLSSSAPLSGGRRFASWIVDDIITLALVGVGVGLTISSLDSAGLSSSAKAIVVIVVILVLPALYGLLCFNGRSIGCLVAGTAFFSVTTGKRAHNARMMWVMFHRWLWPLLAILFIMALFDSSTSSGPDKVHTQRLVRGVVPVRQWGVQQMPQPMQQAPWQQTNGQPYPAPPNPGQYQAPPNQPYPPQ